MHTMIIILQEMDPSLSIEYSTPPSSPSTSHSSDISETVTSEVLDGKLGMLIQILLIVTFLNVIHKQLIILQMKHQNGMS